MKDFYIDPPAKGASPEEWKKWLKREAKAEAVAKAQRTKAMEHGSLADLPGFTPGGTVKVNGRYVQQSVGLGLGGDFESGEGTFDLISPNTQDRYFQQRGKRAKRPKSRLLNKRRNKNKKEARAERFKV